MSLVSQIQILEYDQSWILNFEYYVTFKIWCSHFFQKSQLNWKCGMKNILIKILLSQAKNCQMSLRNEFFREKTVSHTLGSQDTSPQHMIAPLHTHIWISLQGSWILAKLYTLPIAKILSVKNARVWVSMVSYFKKWMKIKILKRKKNAWWSCLGFAC